MTITTDDQLVAAVARGPVLPYLKVGDTGKGAGNYHGYFLLGGTPAAGATPATTPGTTYTDLTAGGLVFPNPVAPALTYLSKLTMGSTGQAHLILYDRLVAVSGLNGTLTTAQTVNTAALPRWTTGDYVEAWLEWYTATGATQVNYSMTYTNQANVSGRVGPTAAFIATPSVRQNHPMLLLSGDSGVRSVQSITLSATTGTAGNFGIVLRRRLASIPLPANSGTVADYFDLGGVQIPDDACLEFVALLSGTGVPGISGEIGIAQG